MNYDVAIIGAGPAGLSAAIYTARGQLKTIVFGDETKSNLYKSHVIANYFACPGTPSGPDLTKLGLQQALDFGVTHHRQEITSLSLLPDGSFALKDGAQAEYQARAVILATGQSYVLSGIRGEQEFTGRGVSYCVTCDGIFFKNKSVVVIGHGEYAAEEALQLTAYTPSITILSHGKDFQMAETTLKQLQSHGIQLLRSPRLTSIEGDKSVNSLKFASPLPDGQSELPVDGVFMAVGIAGANAFAKKLGLEMEGNYIKTDKDGRTNIPNCFAAGDCTGSPPQVASSVGNGCNAALATIKSLRGLNNYIQYH